MAELLDRRYLLQEQIGAGTFGRVYRAEHRVLGVTLRQVAVKVFNVEGVPGGTVEDMLTEVLTAIQALAQCPDPLVRDRFVACYDAAAGERPYLVMELATTDLAHRLPEAQFPVATARDYLRQLCEGMAFLHEQRMVHGDLKPGNILVSATGSLKIADFGCAARIGHLVRRGARGGTWTYQPAEVLDGQLAGPAADVYALGLICYEMLTGQLPHHSQLMAAIGADGDQPDLTRLLRLRLQPVPPPSTRNPAVKADPLEAVVLRALSPWSAQRYPDAGALLRALTATHDQDAPAPPEPALQRIESLLGHLRHALSRGDLDLARQLGPQALQLNRSLPDSAMLADVYRVLVSFALRSGDRSRAQELAQEALRRRRCTASYSAMADAFADSDFGHSFARLSRDSARP
ncbi:MAG: serine/threonine-protein kinase [Pseudonocardiaceae bacterium]